MEDIQTYLPGIILAYSAFLLGISSPGPNVLAVIGTSMSLGRRSGVALALGVATGSLTWAMLTALGLSALLATYAWAITVIKIIGGFYLLWLAFSTPIMVTLYGRARRSIQATLGVFFTCAGIKLLSSRL